MNRTDILDSILQKQVAWISAADARASLVLPLATTMLGVAAAVVPPFAKWQVVPGFVISLAVALLVFSLVACAIATFPRTDGPIGSMIYFGGIASRERAEYVEAVSSVTEDALITDLARQCHVNAQIANIKFLWVKTAVSCLLGSIVPWALGLYLLTEAVNGAP